MTNFGDPWDSWLGKLRDCISQSSDFISPSEIRSLASRLNIPFTERTSDRLLLTRIYDTSVENPELFSRAIAPKREIDIIRSPNGRVKEVDVITKSPRRNSAQVRVPVHVKTVTTIEPIVSPKRNSAHVMREREFDEFGLVKEVDVITPKRNSPKEIPVHVRKETTIEQIEPTRDVHVARKRDYDENGLVREIDVITPKRNSSTRKKRTVTVEEMEGPKEEIEIVRTPNGKVDVVTSPKRNKIEEIDIIRSPNGRIKEVDVVRSPGRRNKVAEVVEIIKTPFRSVRNALSPGRKEIDIVRKSPLRRNNKVEEIDIVRSPNGRVKEIDIVRKSPLRRNKKVEEIDILRSPKNAAFSRFNCGTKAAITRASLEGYTVSQLIDIAEGKGIQVPKNVSKDFLLNVLSME